MCLAIPGKIVDVKDDHVIVDYEAEKRTARVFDGEYKIGEYVFVQAGIVIQKIPKEEALKALEEWRKLLKNEA